MKNLFKQWIFPLLLALLTGVIAAANYTPGTWLIGWDNLNPEFNFPLAFERMLNGVWRADQGLGAVAGHSHMADLVPVAILWLGSLIVQPQFLRYGFYLDRKSTRLNSSHSQTSYVVF